MVVRIQSICMETLNCSPEKATSMLNKQGIRRDSDFGRTLQEVITKAGAYDEEVEVEISDRERAQMIFPFIILEMKELPEDTFKSLIRSSEDRDKIRSWPETRFSEEDYNEMVGYIQELGDELMTLITLNQEERQDIMHEAAESMS